MNQLNVDILEDILSFCNLHTIKQFLSCDKFFSTLNPNINDFVEINEKTNKRLLNVITNDKWVKNNYENVLKVHTLTTYLLMTNIDTIYMNFNNLKSLNFISTDIKKIENLPINLQSLTISYAKLTKIENLQHLYKLHCLDLSGNNITTIENLPPNLTILFLDNCFVETIYSDSLPTSLTRLDLIGNKTDINPIGSFSSNLIIYTGY